MILDMTGYLRAFKQEPLFVGTYPVLDRFTIVVMVFVLELILNGRVFLQSAAYFNALELLFSVYT